MSDQLIDERIKMVRDNAISWTVNADTKATALLAIQGVLLGLVAGKIDTVARNFNSAMMLAFFAMSGLSCMASAWVLFPRTKRKKYDSCATEESWTFFRDVASLQDSNALKQKLENFDWQKDALSQAFIVNKIVARKMKWLRIAVSLVLLGFVCLLVAVGSQAITLLTK